MPPPPLLVATALALAVPVAGCGGAGPMDAGARDAGVTLDDFSARPQRLAVKPGVLRLAVANRGRITHTLVLERGEAVTGRVPRPLKPGRRGVLRAALPRGEYRMLCPIANHEELGLWGTVTVR